MRHLSDEQLLGELESLKVRERTTTLAVLRDLIEVERRKLHLKLGYASLFDFATRHLGYSESAAGRRIQAARCIARYPEVRALLERDEVNLSTIAMVSRILNDTNKDALLAAIRNKSQRAVEAIVVAAKPATRVRDRIQLVKVPVAVQPAPHPVAQPQVVAQPVAQPQAAARAVALPPAVAPAAAPSCSVPNGTGHSRSGSGPEDRAESAPAEAGQAGAVRVEQRCTEQRFKLQFAVGNECMRKFEEARSLLSGRFLKGVPFAAVFEAALDALLEKKSPVRRNARRKQRAARRQKRETGTEREIRDIRKAGTKQRERERNSATRTLAGSSEVKTNESGARRHIPAVRDAVFERDGGRCTYAGAPGKRCGSTHDLEIDHRRPVGRGGTNTIDNLRLLCARHNLLEAERVYGTEWIQRFLDDRGESEPGTRTEPEPLATGT